MATATDSRAAIATDVRADATPDARADAGLGMQTLLPPGRHHSPMRQRHGVVHVGPTSGSGALAGFLAGVVAYLLGFLLAAGLLAVTSAGSFARVVAGPAQPTNDWLVAAWFFYGGHLVETVVTDAAGADLAVAVVGGPLWSPAFLAVPAVALAGAGAGLAALTGRRSARAGAATGASVVLGYWLPAGLGAVLSTWSPPASTASVAPQLGTAFWQAGIVYPVVLGAAGGALVGVARQRRRAVRAAPDAAEPWTEER